MFMIGSSAKRTDPETLRKELVDLLIKFKSKLLEDDLRDKVKDLIPANHLLRDLGSSLIDEDDTNSARERILAYFRKYPTTLICGDEIMVVAGISEYARRIRELRVEMGWPIQTGLALKDIIEDDEGLEDIYPKDLLKKDYYVLTENKQDRDAAYRWKIANTIRKSNAGVKSKIIDYFLKNVGNEVTGVSEELSRLATIHAEIPMRGVKQSLNVSVATGVATRLRRSVRAKRGVSGSRLGSLDRCLCRPAGATGHCPTGLC